MSDPSRLVNTLTAYWQSATLVAAIDLGIFGAVARGARTATAIARACRGSRPANPAAIGRLCDALVVDGWLRAGRGGYRLTSSSAALDPLAKDSLAGLRHFFNAPPMSTGFASLADTVRRGRAQQTEVDWARFAKAALPLRQRLAASLASTLQSLGLGGGHILDVGAGASPLGLALLKRHRTATLTAIDDRSVLRLARRSAAEAGLSARLTTISGDARIVEWPTADLIVMVNVLDYFLPRDQTALLRKARRALSTGGTLAIAAPLLDASRRSPEHAVAYDLMLMALGGGAASTTVDMRARLRQAGFRRVTWMRDADLMLASV